MNKNPTELSAQGSISEIPSPPLTYLDELRDLVFKFPVGNALPSVMNFLTGAVRAIEAMEKQGESEEMLLEIRDLVLNMCALINRCRAELTATEIAAHALLEKINLPAS